MLLSVPQIRTKNNRPPAQTISGTCTVRESPHLFHPAARWPAPAVLRYWHLASLDAPTVAVVWSLAFAWAAGVRLAAWVIALQVLTVWTVYVGDRLLDARAALRQRSHLARQLAEDLRERHYFHWRYRHVLAPAACVAACAAAYLAVRFMPIVVKERDSLLAAASAVYFTRVHAGRVRRILRKELIVGILFAVGCALPAASPAIAVPAIFFAALAWLNCWAIEIWEGEARQDDRAWQEDREKPEKIPLLMRHRAQPRTAAIGLASAGFLIAAMLLPFTPRAAAMLVAAALSALLLALIGSARERMTVVAVRALADLVLLTPALLLAMQFLPFRNFYQ